MKDIGIKRGERIMEHIDLLYKQTENDYRRFSSVEKKQLVHNLAENLMFLNDKTQEEILKQIQLVNMELYNAVKNKL